MRPTGGCLGGAVALELGTEHQQHGTPHAHGQLHVVCRYQYGTLQEIASKIEEHFQQGTSRTLLDEMKEYHDWFHVERVLDSEEHAAYSAQAQENFFEGFRSRENDAQVPAYLGADAVCPEKL